MALIAVVIRDGIARLYDGQRCVALPGVAAREDGQTGWAAGLAALSSPGLRLRVEDGGDAPAYWAVLAEGLLELRFVGAANVIMGMGKAEFERVGREVGRLIQSRCGGRVALRYGDHFALYALAPWNNGEAPPDSQETVVLRVGAEWVQEIRLVGGNVSGESRVQPGWDQAVVWAAVRKAYIAGRRIDVHEATWDLFSAPDSAPVGEEVESFAKMLADGAAASWRGQKIVISGAAGQVVWPLLRQILGATAAAPPEAVLFAEEAVGLWNLARLQGLEP